MKVTLETTNGVFTIDSKIDADTLDVLVALLIVPVLLAAGYHQDTVSEIIRI